MTDPTDLQLANFACLRLFGVDGIAHRDWVASLFETFPEIREGWAEQHVAYQDELRKLAAPVPDRG